MTDDVYDPRLGFSEWLHEELVAEYATETEAWAKDRVARVMEHLNTCRVDQPALTAEILWLPEPIAFTAPGRYVYIARPLLERLPTDEAVAFVLAHETGHHDCGHLTLYTGWTKWLPHARATAYLAVLGQLVEHHTYGPEREVEADAYAVRLCLHAGYAGDRCVHAFDVLEALALDRGDISGVYGPENLLDPTDPDRDSRSYHIQRWLWTHSRGYLPLDERRTHARALLAQLAGGTGCDTD